MSPRRPTSSTCVAGAAQEGQNGRDAIGVPHFVQNSAGVLSELRCGSFHLRRAGSRRAIRVATSQPTGRTQRRAGRSCRRSRFPAASAAVPAERQAIVRGRTDPSMRAAANWRIDGAQRQFLGGPRSDHPQPFVQFRQQSPLFGLRRGRLENPRGGGESGRRSFGRISLQQPADDHVSNERGSPGRLRGKRFARRKGDRPSRGSRRPTRSGAECERSFTLTGFAATRSAIRSPHRAGSRLAEQAS